MSKDRDQTRRQIQEGWDSLRRGETVDGEEFMDQLLAALDDLDPEASQP